MKKMQIAVLIALLGCLTAPSTTVAETTKKFVDNYVQRISVEYAENYKGENEMILRVYFSKYKNAQGKKNIIGNCTVTPVGSKSWFDAMFQLAHTAYNRRKRVYAECIVEKQTQYPNSDGFLTRLVLKNIN